MDADVFEGGWEHLPQQYRLQRGSISSVGSSHALSPTLLSYLNNINDTPSVSGDPTLSPPRVRSRDPTNTHGGEIARTTRKFGGTTHAACFNQHSSTVGSNNRYHMLRSTNPPTYGSSLFAKSSRDGSSGGVNDPERAAPLSTEVKGLLEQGWDDRVTLGKRAGGLARRTLRVQLSASASLTHFEENPRPQLRTPRGWDDPRVRSAVRSAGATRSRGGPMKHTDYPVCTNRWDGQKDPPRSTPDNMWGGDVRAPGRIRPRTAPPAQHAVPNGLNPPAGLVGTRSPPLESRFHSAGVQDEVLAMGGERPDMWQETAEGHLPELRWSPSPPRQRSYLVGAPKVSWPTEGEAAGGVQVTSAQQLSPSRRGRVPLLTVRAFLLFADGSTGHDVAKVRISCFDSLHCLRTAIKNDIHHERASTATSSSSTGNSNVNTPAFYFTYADGVPIDRSQEVNLHIKDIAVECPGPSTVHDVELTAWEGERPSTETCVFLRPYGTTVDDEQRRARNEGCTYGVKGARKGGALHRWGSDLQANSWESEAFPLGATSGGSPGSLLLTGRSSNNSPPSHVGEREVQSPTYERWVGQGNTAGAGVKTVRAVTSGGSCSRSRLPPRVGPRQRPRNASVSFDESKAARRKKIIQQVEILAASTATTIAKIVRGYQARQRFQEHCIRHQKASVIQLCARRRAAKLELRHRRRRRDEAVKIQSLARARASRREASLRYRRHGAATHIQCCGRRMLARKELKTRKRARDSVISLQCWARGLAATRTVDRRREQHRSAVAIECLARKNAAKVALTRRRGEIEARDMQENEASATIQCMARSRTARKEILEQRKQARKREEATLKLQSFARARVAIEEADQKRHKKEAAARRLAARKEAEREHDGAAIVIQKSTRNRLSKKKERKTRQEQAAVSIQAATEGRLARTQVGRMKDHQEAASAKIGSAARARRARKRVKNVREEKRNAKVAQSIKEGHAAVSIQKAARRRHSSKSRQSTEEHAAAITIQRVTRGNYDRAEARTAHQRRGSEENGTSGASVPEAVKQQQRTQQYQQYVAREMVLSVVEASLSKFEDIRQPSTTVSTTIQAKETVYPADMLETLGTADNHSGHPQAVQNVRNGVNEEGREEGEEFAGRGGAANLCHGTRQAEVGSGVGCYHDQEAIGRHSAQALWDHSSTSPQTADVAGAEGSERGGTATESWSCDEQGLDQEEPVKVESNAEEGGLSGVESPSLIDDTNGAGPDDVEADQNENFTESSGATTEQELGAFTSDFNLGSTSSGSEHSDRKATINSVSAGVEAAPIESSLLAAEIAGADPDIGSDTVTAAATNGEPDDKVAGSVDGETRNHQTGTAEGDVEASIKYRVTASGEVCHVGASFIPSTNGVGVACFETPAVSDDAVCMMTTVVKVGYASTAPADYELTPMLVGKTNGPDPPSAATNGREMAGVEPPTAPKPDQADVDVISACTTYDGVTTSTGVFTDAVDNASTTPLGIDMSPTVTEAFVCRSDSLADNQRAETTTAGAPCVNEERQDAIMSIGGVREAEQDPSDRRFEGGGVDIRSCGKASETASPAESEPPVTAATATEDWHPVNENDTRTDELAPMAPMIHGGEPVVDGEKLTSFGAYRESAKTEEIPEDATLEAVNSDKYITEHTTLGGTVIHPSSEDKSVAMLLRVDDQSSACQVYGGVGSPPVGDVVAGASPGKNSTTDDRTIYPGVASIERARVATVAELDQRVKSHGLEPNDPSSGGARFDEGKISRKTFMESWRSELEPEALFFTGEMEILEAVKQKRKLGVGSAVVEREEGISEKAAINVVDGDGHDGVQDLSGQSNIDNEALQISVVDNANISEEARGMESSPPRQIHQDEVAGREFVAASEETGALTAVDDSDISLIKLAEDGKHDMILSVKNIDNDVGESQPDEEPATAAVAVEGKGQTDPERCPQLDHIKDSSRSEKADPVYHVVGVGEEGTSVHIPRASLSGQEERATDGSINAEAGMAMVVSSEVRANGETEGSEPLPPLPTNQAKVSVVDTSAASHNAAVSTIAAELVGRDVESALSKLAAPLDTMEVERIEGLDGKGELHAPRIPLAILQGDGKRSSETEATESAMGSESNGQSRDLLQPSPIDPDPAGALDVGGSLRTPKKDGQASLEIVERDTVIYLDNRMAYGLEVGDGNAPVDPLSEAASVKLTAEGKHTTESERADVGLAKLITNSDTAYNVQSQTRGSKTVDTVEKCDLIHTEESEDWILDNGDGTPRASSIVESLSNGSTAMEADELDKKAQVLVEAVLREIMSSLEVSSSASPVPCGAAVSEKEGSDELYKPKDGYILQGKLGMLPTEADPQAVRADDADSSGIIPTTAVMASDQREDGAEIDITIDADKPSDGGEVLGVDDLGEEISSNQSGPLLPTGLGDVGMVDDSGVSEGGIVSTEAMPGPTSGATIETRPVTTRDEELTATPTMREAANVDEPVAASVFDQDDGAAEAAGLPQGETPASVCDKVAETPPLDETEDGAPEIENSDNVAPSNTLSATAQEGFSEVVQVVAEGDGPFAGATDDHMTDAVTLEAAISEKLAPAVLIDDDVLCKSVDTTLLLKIEVADDGATTTVPREGNGDVEVENTAKGIESPVSGGDTGDKIVPIQQMVGEAQVRDTLPVEDMVSTAALEEEGLSCSERMVQEEGTDIGEPTGDQPYRHDIGAASIEIDPPVAVAEDAESAVDNVVAEGAVPDPTPGEIAVVEGSTGANRDTLNIDDTKAADTANATDALPPHTRGGDTVDPSLSGPDDTMKNAMVMELPPEGVDAALPPTEDVAEDCAAANLLREGYEGERAHSTPEEGELPVSGSDSANDLTPTQQQIVEQVQVRDEHVVEDSVAVVALEEEGPSYAEGIAQEGGAGKRERTEGGPFRDDAGVPSIETDPPVALAERAEFAVSDVVARDAGPDDILGKAANVKDVADESRDTLNIGDVHAANQPGNVDSVPPQTRSGETVDPSLSGPENTAHDTVEMEVQQEGVDDALSQTETVTDDSPDVALPNKEDVEVEVVNIAKVVASPVSGGENSEANIADIKQQMVREAQVHEQNPVEDNVSVSALETEAPPYAEVVVEQGREGIKEPTDGQPRQSNTGASSAEAHPLVDVAVDEEPVVGDVVVGDVVADVIPGETAQVEGTPNASRDSHDTDDTHSVENILGVNCAPSQTRLNDVIDPRVSVPDHASHISVAMEVPLESVDAALPTAEAIAVGDAHIILPGTEDVDVNMEAMVKEGEPPFPRGYFEANVAPILQHTVGKAQVRDEHQVEDSAHVKWLETETPPCSDGIVREEAGDMGKLIEDKPFQHYPGVPSIERGPPVAVAESAESAVGGVVVGDAIPDDRLGEAAEVDGVAEVSMEPLTIIDIHAAAEAGSVDGAPPQTVSLTVSESDKTAHDLMGTEVQAKGVHTTPPPTGEVAVDGIIATVPREGHGDAVAKSASTEGESPLSDGISPGDNTPTQQQTAEKVQIRKGHLAEDSESVPVLEEETPVSMDGVVREDTGDEREPTNVQPLQNDAGVPFTETDSSNAVERGEEPAVRGVLSADVAPDDIPVEVAEVKDIIDANRNTPNVDNIPDVAEVGPADSAPPQTRGYDTVDSSVSKPDDVAHESTAIKVTPEGVSTALTPAEVGAAVGAADTLPRKGHGGVVNEITAKERGSSFSGDDSEYDMTPMQQQKVEKAQVQDESLMEDSVSVPGLEKETPPYTAGAVQDEGTGMRDSTDERPCRNDSRDPLIKADLPTAVAEGAELTMGDVVVGDDVPSGLLGETIEVEGVLDVSRDTLNIGDIPADNEAGPANGPPPHTRGSNAVDSISPGPDGTAQDSLAMKVQFESMDAALPPPEDGKVDAADKVLPSKDNGEVQGESTVEVTESPASGGTSETNVAPALQQTVEEVQVRDEHLVEDGVGVPTLGKKIALGMEATIQEKSTGMRESTDGQSLQHVAGESSIETGTPVGPAQGVESVVGDSMVGGAVPDDTLGEAAGTKGIANASRDTVIVDGIHAAAEGAPADDVPPHTCDSDTIDASLPGPDDSANVLVAMEVQPESVDPALPPSEDGTAGGAHKILPRKENGGVQEEGTAEVTEVPVSGSDFDTNAAPTLQLMVEEHQVEDCVTLSALGKEAPSGVEAIVQKEETGMTESTDEKPRQHTAGTPSIDTDPPVALAESATSAVGDDVVKYTEPKNIPDEAAQVDGIVDGNRDTLVTGDILAASKTDPADGAPPRTRGSDTVDAHLSGPGDKAQYWMSIPVQPVNLDTTVPTTEEFAVIGADIAQPSKKNDGLEVGSTAEVEVSPISGGIFEAKSAGRPSIEAEPPAAVVEGEYAVGDAIVGHAVPDIIPGETSEVGGIANVSRDALNVDDVHATAEVGPTHGAPPPTRGSDTADSALSGPPAAAAEDAQAVVAGSVGSNVVPESIPEEAAEVESTVDANRDTLVIDDVHAAEEASATEHTSPQINRNDTVDTSLSGPDDRVHGSVPMEVQVEGVDVDAALKPTEEAAVDGTAAALPSDGNEGVAAENTTKAREASASGDNSDINVAPTLQQTVEEMQVRDSHLVDDTSREATPEKEAPPGVEAVVREDETDTRKPPDNQLLQTDNDVPLVEANTPVAWTEASAMSDVVVGDAASGDITGEVSDVEGDAIASSDILDVGDVDPADNYGPADVALTQICVDDTVTSGLTGSHDTKQDATVLEVRAGSVDVAMPSVDGGTVNGDVAAPAIETTSATESLTAATKRDLPASGGGSGDDIASVQQHTVEEVQARDEHLVKDSGSVSGLEAKKSLYTEGRVQQGEAGVTEPTDQQLFPIEAEAPSNEVNLEVFVAEGSQLALADAVVGDTAPDDIPGKVEDVEGNIDAGSGTIPVDEILTAAKAGLVGDAPPQTCSDDTVDPGLSEPDGTAQDSMGREVQPEIVDVALPPIDDAVMDDTAAVLPNGENDGVEVESVAKEGELPVSRHDSGDGITPTQQQTMTDVQEQGERLVGDGVSVPAMEKETQPGVGGVVEEDIEDTGDLTDGQPLCSDAVAPSNESNPPVTVAEGAESAVAQVVIGDAEPENLLAEALVVEDTMDTKRNTLSVDYIHTAGEVGSADGAQERSPVDIVDVANNSETDQTHVPYTDSPWTVDMGALPAGALNEEIEDSRSLMQNPSDGSGPEIGRQTTIPVTHKVQQNGHHVPNTTPALLGSEHVDGDKQTTEPVKTSEQDREKDRLCSRPEIVASSSPVYAKSKGTPGDASDGGHELKRDARIELSREVATVSSEGVLSMREINDRRVDETAASVTPQRIDIFGCYDATLADQNADDGESTWFDLSASEADESGYDKELDDLQPTKEESDNGAAVIPLSIDPNIKLGDSAAATTSEKHEHGKGATVVVEGVPDGDGIRNADYAGSHVTNDDFKFQRGTEEVQASGTPEVDAIEETAADASVVSEIADPLVGVGLSAEGDVRGDIFVNDGSVIGDVSSNDEEVPPQALVGPPVDMGAKTSPTSGQLALQAVEEVRLEENVRNDEELFQRMPLNPPGTVEEMRSAGPAFQEVTAERKASGSAAMQSSGDDHHISEELPAIDSSGRVLPALGEHRVGSGGSDSIDIAADISSAAAGQNGTDDAFSPDEPAKEPPALSDTAETTSIEQDQNEGGGYSASATKPQLPGDLGDDTMVVEMAKPGVDDHHQEADGAEALAGGEEGIGGGGEQEHVRADRGDMWKPDKIEIDTGSDDAGAIGFARMPVDTQQQVVRNVEEVEIRGEVGVPGEGILEKGGTTVVVPVEQISSADDQENVHATSLAGGDEENLDRRASEKVVHVPGKGGNVVGTDTDEYIGTLKVDSTDPKELTQDVGEAVVKQHDKEGGDFGGKSLDASAGKEHVGENSAVLATEVDSARVQAQELSTMGLNREETEGLSGS